jgi:nicotinate-nucleotide adenylyltransferase
MRRPGAGQPVRLPPHAPGMRIGLYGGSFDPPHAGHRHVALTALRRLRLDAVWWLVTPGNPLKDRSHLAAESARLAATRVLARHPRMRVATGEIGAVYTVETIRYLLRRCPYLHFVWIMGADSLSGFHRWRAWREIARLVPLAVVDRPGWTIRALAAPAAGALAASRIDGADAARLPGREPPAWVFLYGPRSNLSSTALRGQVARVDPSPLKSAVSSPYLRVEAL